VLHSNVLIANLYPPDNNKTLAVLQINCPTLHWNKTNFVCWWASSDVQFG